MNNENITLNENLSELRFLFRLEDGAIRHYNDIIKGPWSDIENLDARLLGTDITELGWGDTYEDSLFDSMTQIYDDADQSSLGIRYTELEVDNHIDMDAVNSHLKNREKLRRKGFDPDTIYDYDHDLIFTLDREKAIEDMSKIMNVNLYMLAVKESSMTMLEDIGYFGYLNSLKKGKCFFMGNYETAISVIHEQDDPKSYLAGLIARNRALEAFMNEATNAGLRTIPNTMWARYDLSSLLKIDAEDLR